MQCGNATKVMRDIIVSDLVSLDLRWTYFGIGFSFGKACIRGRAATDFQMGEDIVDVMVCK